MLGGVLKKFLLILLVVVAYQNWGKIERVFNPSQVVSEQTQAKANVVLYATEWCGYCKLTRRFLDQKGIPYKEFDIEKDVAAREDLIQKVVNRAATPTVPRHPRPHGQVRRIQLRRRELQVERLKEQL